MDGTTKQFSTPTEEVKHWRELAERYKTQYESSKEELEEYQISSQELEAELEVQLQQELRKNKELECTNTWLREEMESFKEKLMQCQSSSGEELTQLEEKLVGLEAWKEENQKYIRMLEQANDDLERTKRATVVSLQDFEQRLNMALERNAFLADEKENLNECVQRLKDEARDLRQELQVKQLEVHKKGEPSSEATGANTETLQNGSNRIIDNGYLNQANKGESNSSFTPSARISALNIVGDLLRKVGALETKLASCRNYVKEQPQVSKAVGNSPVNSLRSRKMNRGTSVPTSTKGAMTVML